MDHSSFYRDPAQPWVLVRGAGDLATGVIVRLHNCGFRLLVTECENPSAIRRAAALCEAVWQGTATVEGVTARRVYTLDEAEIVDNCGEIPLLVDETCACAGRMRFAAVADVILAKRNMGTSRVLAPIAVACGPGFFAGDGPDEVDAVVETMRGHRLGRVIRSGAAIANTGIPGNIGGYAAERVMHAPASGPMRFVRDEKGRVVDIGAAVEKGQVIGIVGDTPVTATITGVLRGLIREDYPVTKGLKIADIDPRMEQLGNCDTISDKARAIGGGVAEALLQIGREKGISLL